MPASWGAPVRGRRRLFRPPSAGILETGYGIVASRRGRGHAPEAEPALAGFALAAPGVHTVFADVELSNPASVRVPEKAGIRRWITEENKSRFRMTNSELQER